MAELTSDPYRVLELNFNDKPTDAQIRTAYRKKALLFHPDRNKAPDAAQKFEQVKQASVILLDKDLRKKFDQIYIARAETQKRLDQASADRQAFMKDLELRERQFQQQFEQTFKQASTQA